MHYRKIVIDGKEYQYYIGQRHASIKLPNNKRISPTLSTITGLSPDVIDDEKWDRVFHVTPSIMEQFIRKLV